MGISQADYARRKGVSRQAVHKRVRAGRLSVLPDGTLDPAVADREWDATRQPDDSTEAAPAAVAAPTAASPSPAAASAAVGRPGSAEGPSDAPASLPAPAPRGTYAQAKTADVLYKARLRQLEFEIRTGKYVEVEKVSDRWFELARATRERMLALPARLAAELASMSDMHAIRVRLDQEIRAALVAVAEHARSH